MWRRRGAFLRSREHATHQSLNGPPLGRGKHYVASWLSDRKTGEVMNGKYEMTMGPYTWGGYVERAVYSRLSGSQLQFDFVGSPHTHAQHTH